MSWRFNLPKTWLLIKYFSTTKSWGLQSILEAKLCLNRACARLTTFDWEPLTNQPLTNHSNLCQRYWLNPKVHELGPQIVKDASQSQESTWSGDHRAQNGQSWILKLANYWKHISSTTITTDFLDFLRHVLTKANSSCSFPEGDASSDPDLLRCWHSLKPQRWYKCRFQESPRVSGGSAVRPVILSFGWQIMHWHLMDIIKH